MATYGAYNPPTYTNPTLQVPQMMQMQSQSQSQGQVTVTQSSGLSACAIAIIVISVIIVVCGILGAIGYGIYIAVVGTTVTVDTFNNAFLTSFDNNLDAIPTVAP